MEGSGRAIDTLLLEERRYPPPEDFAAQANAQPDIYDLPFEEFWEREGRDRVSWFEPFETLLEWELPYAKWYVGGKINVAYNCLDRHVEAGRGEKVAFFYEAEPVGERVAVTYGQLLDEVVKAANGLRAIGVGKGTPVGIYMGMGPGLPVAMLACARLGAPFTVVFGGFSAEALSDRLNDMRCEVLLTQDESYRRGSLVPLKRNADEALVSSPTVRRVVVGQRTRGDVPMTDGRDITWNELIEGQPSEVESCPPEPMDSEDLLYLLYTSGTTAKPKGIAHTTAGYLVGRGDDAPLRLRPEARHRRVLVRRRHRLGDGAQLHRLRAALQRGDERVVRGDAGLPGQGPLVGHRRALRRDDPVHGSDRDSRAHEVGTRARGLARSLLAAAARDRRRADQSRGVGVVPGAHRRRSRPRRRHVVADRDRDDHDHAASGGDDREARFRDEAVSRVWTPRSSTTTDSRSGRGAVATSSCGGRGRR